MRALLIPLLALWACDTSPTRELSSAERVYDTSAGVWSDPDGYLDSRDSSVPSDLADAPEADLFEVEDGADSDLDSTPDSGPTDTAPGDTVDDTTVADTGLGDTTPTDTIGDTDTGPAAGSPADPITITRFPWVRNLDTRAAASDILDRYDCATADESGPELVHRFEVESAGELVVEVLENNGVDVDLHLLRAAPPTTTSNNVACAARANTRLAQAVTAGTWWLVVDTYVSAGTPRSGPFTLAVELTVLDAWQIVDVAPGLVWKKKVYANYAGGRQTINVLEVAPALGDLLLKPYLKRGGGCIRPSRVGAEQGAIAAMNAGFFDTGPGTCPPLDLVKVDREVLSYNRLTGAAQRSIGWDEDRTTQIAWVDKDRDWPAVVDGLGSYPSLVTGGTIRLEPDKDSDFFDARHPRTALGVKADGTLIMVVVDGRTAAGVGMTLNALAQHMVNLGAVDAVNLDGGGSTTLWIRDQSINGIVNHPSDNGTGDHAGERAVSDTLLVFAPE